MIGAVRDVMGAKFSARYVIVSAMAAALLACVGSTGEAAGRISAKPALLLAQKITARSPDSPAIRRNIEIVDRSIDRAAQTTVTIPALVAPPSGELPFRLYCPWEAGANWLAGGCSTGQGGGSYFGEDGHLGRDYYAVDFNRRQPTGEYLEDRGELILAAADGVLEVASFINGYGYCVVLVHERGYRTRYAHLQWFGRDYPLKPGDWVRHGTVIGRCGSSGGEYRPHLHFVLYHPNGHSIPPSPMSGYSLAKGNNGDHLVSDNPRIEIPRVRQAISSARDTLARRKNHSPSRDEGKPRPRADAPVEAEGRTAVLDQSHH